MGGKERHKSIDIYLSSFLFFENVTVSRILTIAKKLERTITTLAVFLSQYRKRKLVNLFLKLISKGQV